VLALSLAALAAAWSWLSFFFLVWLPTDAGWLAPLLLASEPAGLARFDEVTPVGLNNMLIGAVPAINAWAIELDVGNS
jgi:hypothetical protein